MWETRGAAVPRGPARVCTECDKRQVSGRAEQRPSAGLPSGPPPASVNKALLEHRHIHSSLLVGGCFARQWRNGQRQRLGLHLSAVEAALCGEGGRPLHRQPPPRGSPAFAAPGPVTLYSLPRCSHTGTQGQRGTRKWPLCCLLVPVTKGQRSHQLCSRRL